uniref:Transcription factor 25 n=1 Tax=Dunaliella tertiolecta TaxID=3047 RepID=A0A7S3QSV4_DUNTE|mmetsp:Transcript_1718/g.4326  ORF Transcript_1718/g.4326 Transcript_1718/m.4326 type:complete len:715 (+) Transcript_1718:107-2251(+)
MPSRQVRKLLQEEVRKQGAEESESENEDTERVAQPFPFSLLSEDEAEQVDEQEDEEQEPTPAPRHVLPADAKASSTRKGKKKGGKKGKGGGGKEDEIDILLKELSVADGAKAAQAAPSAGNISATRPKSLEVLSVDTRALRGDDELRRIFGASVIASVDREEASQINRMRGRGAQRNSAVARRVMKKGLLVTPKDHWPLLDPTAMSMQSNGWKDGVQVFQYTWSQGYRYTQRAFERSQATYDPNAVAALLHQAPYHVDSLLTMYDLYRQLGENQYAEETLLRALYALEMAWHPAFDIRTANCRLDFQVPENRALFVTLFRHVQALSRSGCHRTALECNKLLLALEPQDPLGATCLMDYLALRAESYEYLRDFALHFDGDQSLAIRPNFSFSLALAALRREQQQQQRQQQQRQQASAAEVRAAEAARRGAGPKSSGVGSKGGGKDGVSAGGGDQAAGGDTKGAQEQSALQLMVAAVMLHPSVVPRLQSKLLEKGVGREPRWGQLLLRPMFTQPHDAASASLQHLGSIFVERSHMLWKAPDALELLYTGALAAADLAEGKSTEATASLRDLSLTAENWKCVRQESFPDSSVNEFRHYRLADFSDNVNALPREELQAAMGGDADIGVGMNGPQQHPNHQEMEQRALAELQEHVLAAQQFQQAGNHTNLSEEELRNANPFMMLLRSLLPWVNVGEPGEGEARQPGQPPGGDGEPRPGQ